ncbi:MAG: CpaE family protein [Rhodoluna sp.]
MIDLFKRASETRPDVEGSSICVWGPQGSPGKTSFAINLAYELGLEGRNVLLVDLDTYSSTIGQHFGVVDRQPGLAAAARLVGQSRLNQVELERLSFSYEVGRGRLTVLAGLGSATRWPEISAEKAEGLIAVAMQSFDHVIVDVASPLESGVRQIGGVVERNSAARAAISACSSVVAIFEPTPIGIGRLAESFEQLRGIRQDSILVANRLRASALGQRPRQQVEDAIMQLCRQQVDAFIDADSDAFDRAQLESVPLALIKRSSKARQAIAQFARLNILKQAGHAHTAVARLD